MKPKKKKYYHIEWAYDSFTNIYYTDYIKAKSAPQAWIKLCRKHALPIYALSIEEVKE